MSRRRPCPVGSGPGSARRVLPGYGERHVCTVWLGTGETRLRSFVSKDHRYRPMVKSGGAQRESDGVVVLQNAVSNAASGKGPDFGVVSGGGKRGGMAGTARSNHPGGGEPVVLHRLAPVGKVRELQRKLCA